MRKTICALVPDVSVNEQWELVNILDKSELVETVVYTGMEISLPGNKFCHLAKTGLNSVENLKILADKCTQDYLLIISDETPLYLGQFCIERMIFVADSTGAGIVYSNYIEIKEGKKVSNPLTDYQEGSLRDDFKFGPLLLINAKAFRQAVALMKQDIQLAGLYYLRLKISQHFPIIHIPEYLYSIGEPDSMKISHTNFDYVDPKNREMQIESEKVVTEHLNDIGAFLQPLFKPVNFDEDRFEYKASVIIPVKNRMKTIQDAVTSVFRQKTNFKFNLIVIDNHSNDGTGEILENIAGSDNRLIHHVPENNDLNIGGCWNQGIHHEKCGMFAVQLDSDDVYKDKNTLQKIIDAFYLQKCPMIIGSYQLMNFKFEEIPPGLIDHKEWTPENGRNNALRINGLGAPRAYYTPVIREINFPNVSYGEDYAVGLSISRHYQIGRIYENLYLCRRWEDNTDASPDIEKQNAHDHYKDLIRTIELKARQKLNSGI